MTAPVLSFLVAALAAYSLTPSARALAFRLGVLDRAVGGRKVHSVATPRTGGLAIVCAFLLALGLAALLPDVAEGLRAHGSRAAGLVAGGITVGALGLVDDARGVRPRTKLVFQAGAALLAWASGHRVEALALPTGGELALGPLALPFTALWIVGLVNATNLVDGLDGLAGGIAFFALAAIGVIAAANGASFPLLVAAALAGAVLGFLPYNVHPATIFMGDTGSMFLGFVLAVIGIHAVPPGAGAVPIAVPLVALAIPIGDTALAMARRTLRGVPLSRADRGHVHHRVLASGLSHAAAVRIMWAAAAVLACAAVALAFAPPPVALAILAVLAALAAWALRCLDYLRAGRTAELVRDRRRNLARRAAVRALAARLRAAPDLAAVREAVRPLAAALGARAIALDLGGADGALAPLATFEQAFAPGADLVRTRHELAPGREAGVLEIGWDRGDVALDRDAEIAIDLACETILAALRRNGGRGRTERAPGPLQVDRAGGARPAARASPPWNASGTP